MASKTKRILNDAERVLIQNMTDEELADIVAEEPDPEFQALLKCLSLDEIEAICDGDLTPLCRQCSKL